MRALRDTLPQSLAERLLDVDPAPVAPPDGVSATTETEARRDGDVIVWETTVVNEGREPVSLAAAPVRLRFDVDPAHALPRIRRLRGSWHYDACYPPRAFRLVEESFPTHKASKPVRIGGANAGVYTPVLQFALSTDEGLDACFVSCEWPGGWEWSAGWESQSHFGEERPAFAIEGRFSLGELVLEPGERLTLPRIHVGAVGGAASWQALDDLLRRYVLEDVSPPPPRGLRAPVSYDHWFGLYENFDLDLMKAQATRARDIGCEAFCLDAAWYRSRHLYEGLGNWLTAHPDKFPGGNDGVAELSEHVRALGMEFGLWHLVQVAMPGTDAYERRPELYREPTPQERWALRHQVELDEDPDAGFAAGRMLALERPEAVDYAVEMLAGVFKAWNVTWTRFESLPEDGLAYNEGYNALIDRLRREVPGLYVEGCNGGGQRMDLATLSRVHGTWLTDHTWAPEICRFMQTGALRFWPAHVLNAAVAAERGEGDRVATSHELLSRMVGVLSFNGDIAQWSEPAVALVREHVDVFKAVRHLHELDVAFPLPQPRSVDDWDAVVYGGPADAQRLLYVFRDGGPGEMALEVEGGGRWRRLLGPASAELAQGPGALRVSLPPSSAALWICE